MMCENPTTVHGLLRHILRTLPRLPESRRRRGLGRTNSRSSGSAARCASRAASGGSRGRSVSTLKSKYSKGYKVLGVTFHRVLESLKG